MILYQNVFILFLMVVATAKEISVDWFIPSDGGPLPAITASPGDKLIFSWTGDHDVYWQSVQKCVDDHRRELHGDEDHEDGKAEFVGNSSPVQYEIKEQEKTPLYFACHVEGHCQLGQVIQVNVVDDGTPPASEPPAIVPTSRAAKISWTLYSSTVASFGWLALAYVGQ